MNDHWIQLGILLVGFTFICFGALLAFNSKKKTSNQFSIYVDGSLVSQSGTDAGTATAPINNFTNLLIGAHQVWSAGGTFKGELDDIRIWNRVLSSAEINFLYTH